MTGLEFIGAIAMIIIAAAFIATVIITAIVANDHCKDIESLYKRMAKVEGKSYTITEEKGDA